MGQLASLQTIRDKKALENILQKLQIQRISWRKKLSLVNGQLEKQDEMVLYILIASSQEFLDIDLLDPISSVQIKNIHWKNLKIQDVRKTENDEYILVFRCKKPPCGFKSNEITIEPKKVVFHLVDENHPQANPVQIISQK